jgi:ATP-binding cassette subfamily B protein
MIPVRQYWNLLVDYLRPYWPRVVLLGVLLFTGIAFQLINPQIVRAFIDRAIEGADQPDLIRLALLFAVLAVGHQALSVIATYMAENIGWSATNELRGELADHCLRLDMGFHKTRTPGEMIERIDGDVTALSNFFSQFVIHVVGNLILLVGILVLLFRENLIVGLGITAFAAAALAAMVGIQNVALPWWKRVRQRSAEFYGFLGEQLGGTEDIRSNGATGFFLRRFTEHLRAWLPDAVRGFMGWAVLWSTNIIVFAVGTALVYWLGSRLFGDGTLTIGSVYLVFTYTELLRQPLDRIRHQMEDLQKAGAGMTRVEELFDLTSRLEQHGDSRLPQGSLALQFDAVTFAYQDGDEDQGELVLDDVSFRVAPGRVVGVLGRTGSGKTTLARLLTRLYDPIQGRVLLGGVAATEADTDDLRHRVGMVTQDVQLFRASVRDNLTFFDPTASDDAIMEVLFDLGLADWVYSLEDGLETQLESGSGGLSAGEAQLLAFTRIFLKDPGLVILDEASSRLDPATEQLIERAVDKLLADRTGIIIAHRLATVTRADDILILDGGRVVEFGERLALAADPASRFSGFLRAGLEEVLA